MPFTKHDICAIKTLEKHGSVLTSLCYNDPEIHKSYTPQLRFCHFKKQTNLSKVKGCSNLNKSTKKRFQCNRSGVENLTRIHNSNNLVVKYSENKDNYFLFIHYFNKCGWRTWNVLQQIFMIKNMMNSLKPNSKRATDVKTWTLQGRGEDNNTVTLRPSQRNASCSASHADAQSKKISQQSGSEVSREGETRGKHHY